MHWEQQQKSIENRKQSNCKQNCNQSKQEIEKFSADLFKLKEKIFSPDWWEDCKIKWIKVTDEKTDDYWENVIVKLLYILKEFFFLKVLNL